MSEQPTVSVIIPHFNDLANLDVCLAALRAQTYPAARLQVIVADNASPQGLAAVQAAAGDRAHVVLVEERGAGPARNGGVAKATGKVLAFIDSDCVADPRWIEEGVAALSRYDFVGGQVSVLVGDEQHMTPVEAWERVFAFDFKTYIEKKGFTGSGNLFCPRSLFESVGGFRAGISEDYEWSKRAQSCGFKLGYAPLAIVGHPARRNWDELTRKWRRLNIETYGLSAGRGWTAHPVVCPEPVAAAVGGRPHAQGAVRPRAAQGKPAPGRARRALRDPLLAGEGLLGRAAAGYRADARGPSGR